MRADSNADAIRQRYAALASEAASGGTCCSPDEQVVFGAGRYDPAAIGALAVAAIVRARKPIGAER